MNTTTQPEVVTKLHTALFKISPITSEREKIIEQMGETIWLESLAKILESLPEDKRMEIVNLLNQDALDQAIGVLDTTDIDVDAIITEVATSVLHEVAGVTQ